VYTESDWNSSTYETAVACGIVPIAYAASKALAERAAIDLCEKQTDFSLVSLCAPWVYGPIVNNITWEGLNTSSADLARFVTGDVEEVPMASFSACIDARDLAEAHVSALTLPEMKGGMAERFVTSGDYMDYHLVCGIVKKNFPWLVEKGLCPDVDKARQPPLDTYKLDNRKSIQVLGVKYRGLEETVTDAITGLLKLQAEAKASSENKLQ
jgi:nucleoside-diphosphate-sugar epimerase